jgi:hypothetical protein
LKGIGSTGVTGLTGVNGATGTGAAAGAAGTAGTVGIVVATGVTGTAGVTGATGLELNGGITGFGAGLLLGILKKGLSSRSISSGGLGGLTVTGSGIKTGAAMGTTTGSVPAGTLSVTGAAGSFTGAGSGTGQLLAGCELVELVSIKSSVKFR